jgi:hypothetical protein
LAESRGSNPGFRVPADARAIGCARAALKEFGSAVNKREERASLVQEEEMGKVLFGLILGGVLGIFDGLTALFTPEVKPMIVGIVIGSTVKGLIAGALIGYFARKVNSRALGILFGLAVGLVLAFAVAAMPSGTGKHYYMQIMLPGGILGLVVGYGTQRFKSSPQMSASH